jgi:hypothetical protein
LAVEVLGSIHRTALEQTLAAWGMERWKRPLEELEGGLLRAFSEA